MSTHEWTRSSRTIASVLLVENTQLVIMLHDDSQEHLWSKRPSLLTSVYMLLGLLTTAGHEAYSWRNRPHRSTSSNRRGKCTAICQWQAGQLQSQYRQFLMAWENSVAGYLKWGKGRGWEHLLNCRILYNIFTTEQCWNWTVIFHVTQIISIGIINA